MTWQLRKTYLALREVVAGTKGLPPLHPPRLFILTADWAACLSNAVTSRHSIRTEKSTVDSRRKEHKTRICVLSAWWLEYPASRQQDERVLDFCLATNLIRVSKLTQDNPLYGCQANFKPL